MSFQDALSKLGRDTAATVLRLYEQVPEGSMALEEFAPVAAQMIAQANAQGVALAELSLNALLITLGASPVDGADLEDLAHWLEEERLTAAVTTAAGIPEQAATRLTRLTRSEVVEAGQRAFGESMRRSGDIEGWVREREGDACELCDWWWREGRVWPKTHSMPTHKGCECTQRPVITDRIAGLSRKAMDASADRDAYGSVEARRLVDPSRYSKQSVKK